MYNFLKYIYIYYLAEVTTTITTSVTSANLR